MSARFFLTVVTLAVTAALPPHSNGASTAPSLASPVVVIVPGSTGSMLRQGASGEVIWGRGRNLVRPRDLGYNLAHPLRLRGAEGELEALPLERMRLWFLRKPIYGPVLDAFADAGWTKGDVGAPRPGDDLFLFPYDWRLDNVIAARRLTEALEKIRKSRGAARLPVILICQSNGGHICRYFVRYGGAGLERAESGAGRRPVGLAVRKIVFMGASNGGSLRMFKLLHQGRRYLAPFGRRMGAETLFTFRSLFQDLPEPGDPLFLDLEGKPRAVDLFDADEWRRFGWSIFAPGVGERIEREGQSQIFGTPSEQLEYLREMLVRARRFRRLLATDTRALAGVAYHVVASSYKETDHRAVLDRRDGAWVTLFPGDRELRDDAYLQALTTAPGDGHATYESVLALSPGERRALVKPVFTVNAPHFEMILAPETLHHLIEIIGPPGAPPATESEGARSHRYWKD